MGLEQRAARKIFSAGIAAALIGLEACRPPIQHNQQLPPPDLKPDTTPPTLIITGPPNNTTIGFNTFCFPMHVRDDRSRFQGRFQEAPEITVRHSFDGQQGDWGEEVAPCYYDVADGVHSFTAEARDGAGNVTPTDRKTFTVLAGQE